VRRLALLLLLPALAACPRPAAEAPAAIDCATVGRPELGTLVPLDCDALVEQRFPPLVVAGEPEALERAPTYDPLVIAARTDVEGLARAAAERCTARNRCELEEAAFRAALDEEQARADRLRGLAQQAAPGAATRDRARRELAALLGVAAMAPGLGVEIPAACPGAMAQPCGDGTCAPEGATCCDDGTYCADGQLCTAGGGCAAAPRCGGAWPVPCPDGTCAPAGASCCGGGRFCRSGTCCGEGACCAPFEACVAGRCVPGAQAACDDPARPIPCPDGACAPVGGSCCGDGRICASGTCCGEGACCFSGEQCVDGRCVGPDAPNPKCRGAWPVTCADGTCAPAGAACCGEGRYCAAGSSCCGSTCCRPGEICRDGACVGG